MSPFVYPKSRHVRRENPPPFSDYRRYKPHLQREFERKCVYCLRPDTIDFEPNFGVDHYRPKSRFPGDATRYSNLYYCCGRCNRYKGPYWPATPDEAAERFIPNPCDHVMRQHLRFAGGEVEARSRAGAHALELLDLNDPEFVGFREFVNTMLLKLLVQRSECLALLKAIAAKEQRLKPQEAARRRGLAEEDLKHLDAAIARYMGSTPTD